MAGPNSIRSVFPTRVAAALFIGLFLFAIPWWWQFLPDLGDRVVVGAPLWFITSVAGSLAVSIVTAYFLSRAWQAIEDDPEDPSPETDDGGPSHE